MEELTTQNVHEEVVSKIDAIRELLNIEYSDDEKQKFLEWKRKIPQNSLENPVGVGGVDEIIELLPDVGNWNMEPASIFFQKVTGFTNEEFQLLFKKFSENNPNFEISLVKISENIISIGIGSKESCGFDKEGEYYGHYHPIDLLLNVPNKKSLPESFINGFMPSRGDLVGWENFFKNGQRVTKIFTKVGYVEVGVDKEFVGFSKKNIDEFASRYFDLFLGKNNLGISTDQEVLDYFKDKFSLTLEFCLYN